MLALLSIAGSAGNALVLCVFTRRKDNLVSTIYIISLAVVDFITCLLVVPFTIYMEHVNFCISSDAACKVRVAVVITLATSNEKRNATVWRPSVCPSVCLSGHFSNANKARGAFSK